MTPDKPEYTMSSGNVFADLGLPQSDELLAKAALVHQIASIAKHRHMTQAETAHILGTTQPKVSDLFAGRLGGFSMERLIRFLNALDRDVDIVVSQKPKSRTHATVKVIGKSPTVKEIVRKPIGANVRQTVGGASWTPPQVQELKTLAKQNTPTRLVALKMRRTPDAIQSAAQKENISLKPTNQSPYNRQKK